MTFTNPLASNQQTFGGDGVCENNQYPVEGSSKQHQNQKQNAQPVVPEQQQPEREGDGKGQVGRDSSGLPNLLTPHHLKSYPIVASSESAIKLIPLSGYMTNATKSTFTFFRKFQPIKYLVETSDIYSDLLLTKLDTWAPSLQTVEVQDLTNPITTPVVVAVDTMNYKFAAINESVSKNIIDPVNKTIVEPTRDKISTVSQELHNKTHDVNGKNIFIKPVDPVVAPFNESLEQFVDNHFPNHKKLTHEKGVNGTTGADDKAGAAGTGAGATGAATSEIARTFKIVGSIMTKETGTTSQDDVKVEKEVKKTSCFFR
ncbi:hypothetical protein CANMA_003588 [Candida margitis]|uniref:uncharacterized protein n=1 Tax=Candida margitis TaxID=1775924 RepID=UPI002225E3D3|nr:uncharacterized protein CANMA_003588 [Candida margitis]KAI5963991.1 hypothetical protein CANMA_003588 [Candida margitis]